MSDQELQVVTTRLLASDVVEIKKRAAAQGLRWQTYFRVMVSKALQRKEEIA